MMHSRRDFLCTALGAGGVALAATVRCRAAASAPAGAPITPTSVLSQARVALTTGQDRADIAFQALKAIEKQVTAAIGDRRVILKPNNVVNNVALSCTNAQNLEGILEFLKSIGKSGNVIIAESGASAATLDGFASLGYNSVANKYNVKLVDLDKEAYDILPCLDQNDMRAHPCRVSRLLKDPSNFIISAAKLKTHDTVVATLSLKNIVMAAPLKIGGSDKRIVHGNGRWAINCNLATFATQLHPHLAVIDGFQGMEGNGPVNGTPVEHRVCVASLDWLAADRVGLELMGVDPAQVGYLTYCSQLRMGEFNFDRIEVVGERVKDHVRKYKLAGNIQQQLEWMTPPANRL